MGPSHGQQFRQEVTSPAADTGIPPGADCLYGLYMNWCLLRGTTPKPGASFLAGTRECHASAVHARLRMKARAATAYVLANYPRT
jgi:hypothetical protein